MRRTLTDPRQEAELEEFGFAVVEFLTEELIEQLRQLHTSIGDAPDDPGRALYFGFHSEALDYKRRMHDAILDALREPAAELFEDHEIYLGTFIVKWPGPNSGFGPHQDPTLVDERFYRGVTLWAPLCDTGRNERGEDNGMLHVVPGSQRFRQYARVRDVDQSIYAGLEAEILAGAGSGIPTRLGQAIVFDDRLIHYSVANATPEPRVVVSIGLRPRESRCVLVRPASAGGLEMFEVPDSSFIEVTASAQELWRPEGPATAHFDARPEPMSAAEFLENCRRMGAAPHTVSATPVAATDGVLTVDPGAFCAFCGADLSGSARAAKGKAQLECADCATERAGSVRYGLGEEGYRIGPPLDPDALNEIEGLFTPFAEAADAPFWSSNVHASRAEATAISAALCAIVGGQLAEELRGYTPFLGAFITKGVGDHLVDFHQDWTYTDERTDRCVLAWIPLIDVDIETGALQAIAGSHRWTEGIRPGDLELPAPTDGLQGLLAPLAEAIPARRGEPVLYDPALIHGSGRNQGDRLRVAAAVAFAPTGAPLVQFQRTVDDSGTVTLEGFPITPGYFTEQEFRSRPTALPEVNPWAEAVAPEDFANSLVQPTGTAEPFTRNLATGNLATGRPERQALRDRGEDARLRADGFHLGVRRLFEPRQLADWRGWYLDRASGREPTAGFEADLNIDDPDYRRDVRRLLEPTARPVLEAMFAGFTPFLYSFLCKWPGDTEGLYLHQDWMYIDERKGDSTFVVWIPLQDVTGHNGQLRLLRGSHGFDHQLRGTELTGDWVDDVQTITPHLIDLPVPAGVPVVLNNRLVHCSYPNHTAEPRVVVAIGMRPADRPLTYFRAFGEGFAARYEVDDEFFCTHTTVGLHLRAPEAQIAEIVQDQRPDIDAARLLRLIEAENRSRQLPLHRRGRVRLRQAARRLSSWA